VRLGRTRCAQALLSAVVQPPSQAPARGKTNLAGDTRDYGRVLHVTGTQCRRGVCGRHPGLCGRQARCVPPRTAAARARAARALGRARAPCALVRVSKSPRGWLAWHRCGSTRGGRRSGRGLLPTRHGCQSARASRRKVTGCMLLVVLQAVRVKRFPGVPNREGPLDCQAQECAAAEQGSAGDGRYSPDPRMPLPRPTGVTAPVGRARAAPPPAPPPPLRWRRVRRSGPAAEQGRSASQTRVRTRAARTTGTPARLAHPARPPSRPQQMRGPRWGAAGRQRPLTG
jgi:hypothetical protein